MRELPSWIALGISMKIQKANITHTVIASSKDSKSSFFPPAPSLSSGLPEKLQAVKVLAAYPTIIPLFYGTACAGIESQI